MAKDKEPRDKQIHIRVAASKRAELDAAAQHAGLTLSQYLLSVALRDARRKRRG